MSNELTRIITSSAVERQQDRALSALGRQHERTAARLASMGALTRQAQGEVLGVYMAKHAAELMCPDAADALTMIAVIGTGRLAEEIEMHGRRP